MGSLPLLHLSIAGSVPQDFQALERQSEQEADDGCSPAQRLSLHETVGENRNLFFTFNKCDQDAMPDSPFVGVRMMGPDGQATWKNPMFLHFVWIGSPVTVDHPHLTASHLPHVNLGIMSIWKVKWVKWKRVEDEHPARVQSQWTRPSLPHSTFHSHCSVAGEPMWQSQVNPLPNWTTYFGINDQGADDAYTERVAAPELQRDMHRVSCHARAIEGHQLGSAMV